MAFGIFINCRYYDALHFFDTAKVMSTSTATLLQEYQSLYDTLIQIQAHGWEKQLPEQLALAFQQKKHGKMLEWLDAIYALPAGESALSIEQGVVSIGSELQLQGNQQHQLLDCLTSLQPWRKGPFELFGNFIDSEWRSDWKWQRLQPHISSLNNRLVLDVGCGNGYHCWRMLDAGAKSVIGIDPLMLNVMQFIAVKRLHGPAPCHVLPFPLEKLPKALKLFDSVFSMGVLYHRRSPIDHLLELKDCLQPGGELILETLVIEGDQGDVLLPQGRYAQMRNVWFIPSCESLIAWMQRCGYEKCRVVDVSTTSTDEQRTTSWMQFQSLADFLMPGNPQLTVEGLPAPKRAIIVANVV